MKSENIINALAVGFIMSLFVLVSLGVQTFNGQTPGTSLGQQDEKEVELDGAQVLSVVAAVAAFKEEELIPIEKKLLTNYWITIDEEADLYHVSFVPKRTEQDRHRVGGVTSIGVGVSFWVRKSDFQVEKRLFHR